VLQDDDVATILRPTGFGALRADRPLLAIADRLHAVRIDAEGDQIVLGCRRAPLAEGEVVLARAKVASMALPHAAILRIGLQPGPDLLQLGLGLGRQIIAVEPEEDPVADHGRELFDGACGRALRHGRR